MAYKNKYDKTGEASQIGEKAECSFETSIAKAGFSCQKSSFPEEMRHIDFWIEGIKTPRTAVDVKSRKKVKRADDKFNDSMAEKIRTLECVYHYQGYRKIRGDGECDLR
jgi:hypothetical protein